MHDVKPAVVSVPGVLYNGGEVQEQRGGRVAIGEASRHAVCDCYPIHKHTECNVQQVQVVELKMRQLHCRDVSHVSCSKQTCLCNS